MTFFYGCLIAVLCTGALSAAPDSVSVTLGEAHALARANAPEPRRILALQRAADAAQHRSLSPPPLEASLEYAFIPAGASFGSYGERTIALDQTLPNPVSLYHRIREGTALRGQAGEEAREALRLYTVRVTGAYYRAAAERERRTFALLQRDGAASILQAAEARYRAGDAAQMELQTAKSIFAESEIALEHQALRERQALLELTALLGGGTGETPVVYVPADSLPRPALHLTDEEVLAAVLLHSPALQAARRARDAAQASASLAIADILPSFSVGVMDQRMPGSGPMYGVRVGLAVPLWFAFDQGRAIESADARLEAAAEGLRTVETETRGWVLSALAALHVRERETQRYAGEIVPAARALVQLSERAWSAGEAGFLEVVQARRHLAEVSAAAIDAHLAMLGIRTEIQSLIDQEEI